MSPHDLFIEQVRRHHVKSIHRTISEESWYQVLTPQPLINLPAMLLPMSPSTARTMTSETELLQSPHSVSRDGDSDNDSSIVFSQWSSAAAGRSAPLQVFGLAHPVLLSLGVELGDGQLPEYLFNNVMKLIPAPSHGQPNPATTCL